MDNESKERIAPSRIVVYGVSIAAHLLLIVFGVWQDANCTTSSTIISLSIFLFIFQSLSSIRISIMKSLQMQHQMLSMANRHIDDTPIATPHYCNYENSIYEN